MLTIEIHFWGLWGTMENHRFLCFVGLGKVIALRFLKIFKDFFATVGFCY